MATATTATGSNVFGASFIRRYLETFPHGVAGLNKIITARYQPNHEWPATLYRKSSKKILVDHANRRFHPANFVAGEWANPAWRGPVIENKVARRAAEIQQMVCRKVQTLVPIKLDGYWHYCYVTDRGTPEVVTLKELRHFDKFSDVLDMIAARQGGFTTYDAADHDLVDTYSFAGQQSQFPIDIRIVIEKVRPRSLSKKRAAADANGEHAEPEEGEGEGDGEEADYAATPSAPLPVARKAKNKRIRNTRAPAAAAVEDDDGVEHEEVLAQGTPLDALWTAQGTDNTLKKKKLYTPVFPAPIDEEEEDDDEEQDMDAALTTTKRARKRKPATKKNNRRDAQGDEKNPARDKDNEVAEEEEKEEKEKKTKKKKNNPVVAPPRHGAGKTISSKGRNSTKSPASRASETPTTTTQATWFDKWLQDKTASHELVVMTAHKGPIDVTLPLMGPDTSLLIGMPAYRPGVLAPAQPAGTAGIASMQKTPTNDAMVHVLSALRARGSTELTWEDHECIEIARTIVSNTERSIAQVMADYMRELALCITAETAESVIARVFADREDELVDAMAFILRCITVNGAYVAFISAAADTSSS